MIVHINLIKSLLQDLPPSNIFCLTTSSLPLDSHMTEKGNARYSHIQLSTAKYWLRYIKLTLVQCSFVGFVYRHAESQLNWKLSSLKENDKVESADDRLTFGRSIR